MTPAVLPSLLPVGFLNLGFAEMVVFGVIALLVFGDKLPEAMRSIGKGYMKFRRGVQDATRPVREEMAKLEREANRPMAPVVRPRPAPDTTTYSPPKPQPPAGDFRVPYPTGLEEAPPPSAVAPLPPPNRPPEAPPPSAAPNPTPPARSTFSADDEPPPV